MLGKQPFSCSCLLAAPEPLPSRCALLPSRLQKLSEDVFAALQRGGTSLENEMVTLLGFDQVRCGIERWRSRCLLSEVDRLPGFDQAFSSE